MTVFTIYIMHDNPTTKQLRPTAINRRSVPCLCVTTLAGLNARTERASTPERHDASHRYLAQATTSSVRHWCWFHD